jgi:hypothetical protein
MVESDVRKKFSDLEPEIIILSINIYIKHNPMYHENLETKTSLAKRLFYILYSIFVLHLFPRSSSNSVVNRNKTHKAASFM